MKRINCSILGMCAPERFCFPQNSSKDKKQAWIDSHDLFVNQLGRAFTLVDTERQVYFMDAVTGSLYQFGECVSTNQLVNTAMIRDKAAASKFLLSLRATQDIEEAA